MVQRAETTEQLAGVGLSVETASHDIMAVMSRAMGTLDSLLKQAIVAGEIDWDEIERDLSALRGMLSFVESQLKNIQLLFKSSKQKAEGPQSSRRSRKKCRGYSSQPWKPRRFLLRKS